VFDEGLKPYLEDTEYAWTLGSDGVSAQKQLLDRIVAGHGAD
jgi:hypothetical protein